MSVNYEEGYACDQAYSRRASQITEVDRYQLIEEFYHTRLLQACGRALGGEEKRLRTPWTRKILIDMITRLPETLRRPVKFSAEILGTVIMYEVKLLVLRHFPEATAIANVIDEIVTDESGHMQYNWFRMAPIARRLAPMVHSFVLRGMVRGLPQLDGEFEGDRLRARYGSFRPEGLDLTLSDRIWTRSPLPLPTW